MDAGSQPPKRPPTRDLSDLVVPRRPSGVPYPQGEDYDAQTLLTANGYTLETAELIGLLDSPLGIFQAAAARVLGAKAEASSIPSLQKLAQTTWAEETARAQAAYALARMDVAGGRELLIDLLELNPEATPAPLQAAACLARLGAPRGFPLVWRALESSNSLTAMIACKQLYAFASLDGLPLPGGGQVQAYEAFRRTLKRTEANIRGEALAQLSGLDNDEAREILKEIGSTG